MLEILTPLNKLERVTRVIDPDNFVASPGIWAAVQSDGSLANIVTDAATTLTKMVITSKTSSQYESHDTSHGRITTLESIGARIKVDAEGYAGTIAQGDELAVSSLTGQEGKLISWSNEAETGTDLHEIVARCEEIDTVNGQMIFRTISPRTIASAA